MAVRQQGHVGKDRIMSRAIAVTLGWLALASFVGGAQAQGDVAGAGGVPNPSGFLQDYTRLKPVPDKEGRYAWSAPDATLRTYTRFMLPPMEIWIDREAQYRGLAADVVQRLANIYQTAFTQTLAPEFPVVDKPGPGVAMCRFAITGVSPQAPRFTPLDVLPVMATFHLIRAATGTSARVARISAEIEC
jgi:hypothetical protein